LPPTGIEKYVIPQNTLDSVGVVDFVFFDNTVLSTVFANTPKFEKVAVVHLKRFADDLPPVKIVLEYVNEFVKQTVC
jgi:hypothetical protein